tara:strand:- start:911 stop:1204 length:294 start_codon:yes stop_codon:yes gene_type:complete
MDLHTYASERGRLSALAQEIGAQPQLVWQWANAVRRVPQERCPLIERATGGQVTCMDLRPDVAWHRIPCADWPWHPEGKPLIDPTAAVPTAEAQQAA